MPNATLKIKRWNHSMMGDNVVCVILGKRNTGKSVLMRSIMHDKLRHMPYGIAVSGTEAVNPTYTGILPPEMVHEEYSTELLGNIIDVQRKKVQEKKERDTLRARFKSDPHMLSVYPAIDSRQFLILDDFLQDAALFTKDRNLKFTLFNGRHLHINLLMIMQYICPPGWGPAYRAQCDYIFVLRENSVQNRKRIWEMYAGCIPTFKLFNQIMDKVTENYGVLVIDNRTQSNKLSDQIFCYRANPNLGDFRCDSAWELCRRAVTAAGGCDDEDSTINLSALRNTKSTIDIEME